jgi:hypothetical protein
MPVERVGELENMFDFEVNIPYNKSISGTYVLGIPRRNIQEVGECELVCCGLMIILSAM